MELLKRRVVHAKFGAGTVTGLNGSVVRVFFDQCGSHCFRYPDAFFQELKLADAAQQKRQEAELSEE